jgi:signal transduction histidine kinase
MIVADAVLVIVVGSTFAFLLLAVAELRDSARLSRHARDELIAVDAIEKVVIDLETGVRGYVITRDAQFLQPWNEARAAFPAQSEALQRLIGDDPDASRRAQRIVQGITLYIQEYATPLVNAVGENEAWPRTPETTGEGKRRVDALRAELDGLRTTDEAAIRVRQRQADTAARRATVGAAAGLAASIIVVLVFTGYLNRVVVLPVRRAAGMAGRLAGGDFEARLPETSAAEVGELEHAFNAMGSSLATSRDRLAHLLEEQAALRRVATLVARGIRPAEIFSAVAEEIGRLLGADYAGVARFEPDGTSVVVVGRVGEDPVTLPVGGRVELRDYLAAAVVWRTGHPARVDEDAWRGVSEPVAENLRRLKVRSVVASPITVEGRLWGVVSVLTRRDPFPSDIADRMADFTELIATAVGNAESRGQLAASRTRIVGAADEARRRIERDLHDGTQQRLVSLGLKLRLVQSAAPPNVPELRTEIGAVADELNEVVDDLREISRGIHPAILSDGGLRPALRTLARRAAITVELAVGSVARLPEPIEVAAYYVVSEALTNTTRHASASVVQVVGEERDGCFHLSIRDDGVGGADPARGSGLVGLRDRVEALGGSIVVSSPPGEGTLISVELRLGSTDVRPPADGARADPAGNYRV